MAKSNKKRPPSSASASNSGAAPARSNPFPTHPVTHADEVSKTGANTKQSRIVAMLQSPAGATVGAMMKATGWQQHSVRGFLAGVVRKRLKLKLGSKKVDGERVYQVSSGERNKPGSGRRSKRRPS